MGGVPAYPAGFVTLGLVEADRGSVQVPIMTDTCRQLPLARPAYTQQVRRNPAACHSTNIISSCANPMRCDFFEVRTDRINWKI